VDAAGLWRGLDGGAGGDGGRGGAGDGGVGDDGYSTKTKMNCSDPERP